MEEMGRIPSDPREDITAFTMVAGGSAEKVTILTTHWVDADREAQERHFNLLSEDERWFGSLVKKGAYLEKCQTKEQWHGVLRRLLIEYEKRKREAIKLQWETVENRKWVYDTSAGIVLEQDTKRTEDETIDQPQNQVQEPNDPADQSSNGKEAEMVTVLKDAQKGKQRELEPEQKTKTIGEGGLSRSSLLDLKDKLQIDRPIRPTADPAPNSSVSNHVQSVPNDSSAKGTSRQPENLNNLSSEQQKLNTDVPVANGRASGETSRTQSPISSDDSDANETSENPEKLNNSPSTQQELNTVEVGADNNIPKQSPPAGSIDINTSGSQVCVYHNGAIDTDV